MKLDIDKTKQKENMQELTIVESNEVEDKQEESPIYDYLKEHPSIFISIISGFVVVIGFLFNCIIYTDECKYLEYWNLDKKLININSEHQIYELVIMSLLFLGLMVVQLFILSSVDSYYKDKKAFWESNVLSIKMCIDNKRHWREIKKDKKQINRNNNDLIKEQLKREEDIAKEYEESIKKYREAVRFNKKVQNRIRRPYYIGAFLITYSFVLGCFFIFVTMISADVKFIHIIILAIVICSLLWILAYLGLQIGYISNIYKKFIKVDAGEQVELYIKSLEELQNIEKYPVQKLLEFDLKKLLTKDMLGKIVYYFLVLLTVFVGTIGSSEINQIEQNKEFDIIEYENSDYAIMYRDDKYFYLEEVKVEENDIYIYVNNQLRISTDELYSVNREFDNVFRVLDEENK